MMTLISDGIDSQSSQPTTKLSKQLIANNLSQNSDKPNLWIRLSKNSKKTIWELEQENKPILNTSLEMKVLLMKSTGDKREQFQKLKIKDNADHAGHSQPLDLSNHLLESKTQLTLSCSQNKIQLIAPLISKTKDAMEV